MQTALDRQYSQVLQRIDTARLRAGRPPGSVRLVAVTKSASLPLVAQLVALGQLDLGENRVQQLGSRASELPGQLPAGSSLTPRWHMIGHLQRNKVREVLPRVALIHSVDSLRLAQAISEEAVRLRRRAEVLLQVNASLEPQKYGAPVGDAAALAEQCAALPGLQLCGLMTMAELSGNTAAVQAAFARTRSLFDTIAPRLGDPAFRELSMGMSHDFELAIAEGATIVRVGSAIFAGAEGEVAT